VVFPAAIRTDKTEHLTLFNLKIHAIESQGFPVILCQVLNLNHRQPAHLPIVSVRHVCWRVDYVTMCDLSKGGCLD